MEDYTRCKEYYCELCTLCTVKWQQVVKCNSCDREIHTHCLQNDVTDDKVYDSWLCTACLYKLLPFGCIEDNTEFLSYVNGTNTDDQSSNYDHMNLKLNLYLDKEDNKYLLNNGDVDPDENVYSNQTNLSKYNTPAKLKNELGPIDHNFTVMHINTRSLPPKLEEVHSLFLQLPVKILAITETWLDQSTDTISIPDYNFVHKPRSMRKGGGVGFFIKKEIQFHIIEPMNKHQNHTTHESLFITVPQRKGNDLIIEVIYRPSGTSLPLFNEEINLLLAEIANSKKDIILAGDFNVDLLKAEEHEPTKIFYNYMTSYQMLPTILKPTRITDVTASLIDNIFTNKWNKVTDSAIIVTDIADHLPIMIRLNLDLPIYNKTSTLNQRKTGVREIEYFQSLIKQMNWTPISVACASEDVNKAYTIFIENYKSAYDKAFPLCNSTKNKKNSK